MQGNIASKVKLKVEPIIISLGYMLLEVEYLKKLDGNHLDITIFKEGGVSINDCELVHKAIDKVIDELNPTNDVQYYLSVCSPGIDRQIKTEWDFVQNKNKDVVVKLFAKESNKKVYEGKLIEYNNNIVEILTETGNLKFDKTKVASITPKFKIKGNEQ
ncbi:MAG: ribosome maturation factor RimP [Clostridia bacterium]